MKRNIFCYSSIVAVIILQLIFSIGSVAQIKRNNSVSNRIFGINVGFSRHATHFLNGGTLGLNHQMSLKGKLQLHNDLLITINSGEEPLHDASLRSILQLAQLDPSFRSSPIYFITAGIQTSCGISTSILSDKIRIGVGPLFRYQTTNRPDKYSFNIDRWGSASMIGYHTNYVIDRIRPHTLSVGAMFFADLKLLKIKQFDTKANFMYQFDSGKDRIFSVGLKVQKGYKKG